MLKIMAENKKGFILYADQQELFAQLTDEKAGQLIKHVLAYVNDDEPESDDLIINLAFTPIKQQLKRDLVKFEASKKQRSDAGKRSAEARKKQRDSTPVETVERTPTDSTVTVTDNVTVTDKVKVSVINNIDSRKLKFADTLAPYIELYGEEMIMDFYGYWTEPNKSNTKFRYELQKTWSLDRRLKTWDGNNNKFKTNGNNAPESRTESNARESENIKKRIRDKIREYQDAQVDGHNDSVE